jgi:ethylmalonyl-CoA mutase
MEKLYAAGLGTIPVVAGGIIPDEDAIALRAMGVAKVYTPKDFQLNKIMADIIALADPRATAAE